MKKSNLRAFSLVELAVVILVIGILIAGVIRGSAVILKAKLKTAQSLTQSSPVSATPGLRLWLETSLEQSISVLEAEDDSPVTVWYDINPQVSNKLFAYNASSEIVYKFTEGINSVPSLYFPSTVGSNSFFTLSSSSTSVVPAFLGSNGNAFTYFLVYQAEEAVGHTENNVFYNGNINSDGWGYRNSSTNKTLVFDLITDDDKTGGAALSKAEIISVTYSGINSSEELKLYVDGVEETLSPNDTLTVEAPTGGMYIGSKNSTGSASTNWQGYISEIIVFDKKVSNAYRKEIEAYLGKKYSIAVAM